MIAKHNQIRMLILQALAPEYPRPVDSVLLRRCLADLSYPLDEHDFDAYVAYLKERGYVTVEEKKQFRISLVAITANGLDIVDGRSADNGVGVKI